jgi:hypothetical protein
VLAYLSRYTHRVAISNRRLIAVDQHSVTFKVKDYRIEGPGRYTTMTLNVGEFIRRFLIHVLPKGFHRIRHYGLLPARTAPRRSRERVSSWVWPRRLPRRRSRSIRRRRRCSPSLAPAAADACSSSRPSRPAASHATGRPRLSSQSGSTPHECGHDIMHPHRQARSSLVSTRPQRRSTGHLSGTAFHRAAFPEPHRHRCSSDLKTHKRPPSPHRHALAPHVRRKNRDQIAIAHASPSATHLPRVPSLEAFGRRPPCKPNRRDGPSSETLHRNRHRRRYAPNSCIG